jgi:hypothetical protein
VRVKRQTRGRQRGAISTVGGQALIGSGWLAKILCSWLLKG